LLSAEHTWGAQDPRSLLAAQVEKIKSGYFTNAKKESEELIAGAVAPFSDTTVPGFAVINTLSWERNGIVTLTKAQSKYGDMVIDEKDRPVLSQRLSTGELIFCAEQVPALGSKWYKVVAKQPTHGNELTVTTTTLRNDILSMKINPNTGNITSIRSIKNGFEYVDSTTGLNSYQYVTGVYNGQQHPNAPTTVSDVSIMVKENGPLLVSLQVVSKADGVTELSREIKLYHGFPVIHLVNSFDKIATRNKEGIHFGFGFGMRDAVGHIDMPWSIVTPDADQLKGSNKNWFAFQRWVDISDKQQGVTWTAIQSPLIEWGSLSGNILDGARQYSLWQTQVPALSTIYSWPLNNHWDTNFPLEQGGRMQQQYSFMIHDGYDVVAANRFGMETHRPLIVVQARKNILGKALVHISNPRLVISTIRKTNDNKAVLLRVRSISGTPETLTLDWPAGRPREIMQCKADEEPQQPFNNTLEIEPYGMASFRLAF
jgi:alpha-mannosidase